MSSHRLSQPPRSELLNVELSAVFAAQREVILTGYLNCKNSVCVSRLTNRNWRMLLSFLDFNYPSTGQPSLCPTPYQWSPPLCLRRYSQGISLSGRSFRLVELLSLTHCGPYGYPTHFDIYVCRAESFLASFVVSFLDTGHQIDEFVTKFYVLVIFVVKVSAKMKPKLTPDYHRIREDKIF